MLIVLYADNRISYNCNICKRRNRSIIIQIIIAKVLKISCSRNHLNTITNAIDCTSRSYESTTVIKIILLVVRV